MNMLLTWEVYEVTVSSAFFRFLLIFWEFFRQNYVSHQLM